LKPGQSCIDFIESYSLFSEKAVPWPGCTSGKIHQIDNAELARKSSAFRTAASH
jgi:hypothetical protein